MHTDRIIREYQCSGRKRRDHMWFFHPELRWRFDEIEDLPKCKDREAMVGHEMDYHRLFRTKGMGLKRIREILKIPSKKGAKKGVCPSERGDRIVWILK